MFKEILRKFNVLLTIPIILVVSIIYAVNHPYRNYVVLEYHEPVVTSDLNESSIFELDHKEMLNKILLCNFVQTKYEREKLIQDYRESIKSASLTQFDKREYIESDYFTKEQQQLIPLEYTLDEIRMLCTLVYGECGAITNEVLVTFYDEYNSIIKQEYLDASYMHKLCAKVLLNRVNDTRYPDTIYDNIVMPGQYTKLYTYESQSYSYLTGIGSNWVNVVDEVLDVLNGNFEIPSNIIFQSNYSSLGKYYYATIWVDTGYFRSMSYYAAG